MGVVRSTVSCFDLGFGATVGVGVAISEIGAGSRGAVINSKSKVQNIRAKDLFTVIETG